MSDGYPPGCTQRHVDYAAGGYDEYRYNSYAQMIAEDEEEPDYDAELDWLSLLETYR